MCHGNVCRSPLAGVVLADMIGQDRVRSRGVKLTAKGPAAKKVREYAERQGYDLSTHRAAPVTDDDYVWADLVVYMDAGNKERIVRPQSKAGLPLVCLGPYAGEERIPDPAFTTRGPRLNALLDLVVRAAQELGRAVR